jgi:competence protein ComFB
MEPCSIFKPSLDSAVSLNGYDETKGEMRHCTVTNANYVRVLAVLNKIIQDHRYRICRCERCVSDIAALSLNYLPPHYYVDPGRGGEIGSPLVMVESAVIEAIGAVGNNPRHQ